MVLHTVTLREFLQKLVHSQCRHYKEGLLAFVLFKEQDPVTNHAISAVLPSVPIHFARSAQSVFELGTYGLEAYGNSSPNDDGTILRRGESVEGA